MNSTKVDQFVIFVALYPEPEAQRGRRPSPFITAADGSTRYPYSRGAYAYRLHHFKILTALDQGLPTSDPIAATKHLAGSVRRTLWLYLYECLPDFPAKQERLDDLLATHNANLLMQGLERIIVEQLDAGLVTDAGYAALIHNDQRMIHFAERWLMRDKGNRAR